MKIKVFQTHIEITNYELGDSFKLEKEFSYWVKTHFRYERYGMYYDKDEKTVYLPRGIDIKWLENLFCDNAYYCSDFDEIGLLEPIMLKNLPRNQMQREALDFTLARNQYVRLEDSPQQSVNLTTAAGKTYITIATVAFLRWRTIIITRSVDWLKQWAEEIMKHTDTAKDEICLISGSSGINRFLSGLKNVDQYKFLLITHQSIQSYASNHGWEMVHSLFRKLKIGIKVFDEAHFYPDNMFMIDFFTNTKKTYYLTASPFLSDKDKNRIYQLSFLNVASINLFNEERDVRSHYICLWYNSHPSISDITLCSKNRFYNFDNNAYIKNLFTRPNVYKILTIILYFTAANKGKLLLYIGINDMILHVKNWIEQNVPYFSGDIGIYCGLVPRDLRENEKNKRIILSNVKSTGACSNIPGLKVASPLAEPSASDQIALQMNGRLRDQDTYFIDIVDKGFEALVGYHNSAKRREIFKKFCIDQEDIRLNDEKLETMYQNARIKLDEMYREKVRVQYKDLPKIATRVK